MLFGFLLAVPFSSRFPSISAGQRDLYYATFCSTALASICLIAPASFHRIVWEHHLKSQLVLVSSRLAVLGTVFLALALAEAVGLVTDLLFHGTWAAVAAACISVVIVGVWYLLPLAYRLRMADRS